MPMSIFCGLPVIVIKLPVLAAKISAIRKGIGLSWPFLHKLIINGVIKRTTASFTKKALVIPVNSVMVMSNLKGVRAIRIVWEATKAKKPSNCRVAMMIIIPSSNPMVLKSMAAIASSKLRIPKSTMAIAPKKAAEGLSIFTPGKRVKMMPVYVRIKIMSAI